MNKRYNHIEKIQMIEKSDYRLEFNVEKYTSIKTNVHYKRILQTYTSKFTFKIFCTLNNSIFG